MQKSSANLVQSAQTLADRLKQTGTQLVFAESCTAGLAAATLARVPGISQFFCGSAVVYQVPTKESWLHIAPELIREAGVISEAVALAMARDVLTITPHAAISAAITGDLGPDAPPETDGIAWIACATRDDRTITKRVALPHEQPDDGTSLRLVRQHAAAEALMRTTIEFLETI